MPGHLLAHDEPDSAVRISPRKAKLLGVKIDVPSKYRNKPVRRPDGYFASQTEARRWDELLLLQQAGQIRGLARQVKYPLSALSGVVLTHYVADFVYWERKGAGAWEQVVEDRKGKRTREYLLKRKWMLAQYDISTRPMGQLTTLTPVA